MLVGPCSNEVDAKHWFNQWLCATNGTSKLKHWRPCCHPQYLIFILRRADGCEFASVMKRIQALPDIVVTVEPAALDVVCTQQASKTWTGSDSTRSIHEKLLMLRSPWRCILIVPAYRGLTRSRCTPMQLREKAALVRCSRRRTTP